MSAQNSNRIITSNIRFLIYYANIYTHSKMEEKINTFTNKLYGLHLKRSYYYYNAYSILNRSKQLDDDTRTQNLKRQQIQEC